MAWRGSRQLAVVLTAVVTLLGTPAAQAETVDPEEDVYAFGDAPFLGSTADVDLERPVVDLAVTPSGDGYWVVSADGGVFSFGDAGYFGSAGGIDLNRPIVGMAATSSGGGYWLVASDGAVLTYGDARFFGSAGGVSLQQPIVAMAATPSDGGYWLVASDGGVFTYGDAQFFGSAGAIDLNEPIVGIASTPSGEGYWLVASDGGVFSYGDARFFGSAGGIDLNEPIVDLAAAPSGAGYWFVARDGGVFAYGPAAGFRGSAADDPLTKPITAIAATPSGAGYWMAAVGVRICRHPSFTVLFPPRWETNEAGGPCAYFNPDRFRITGTEQRYDLAISMTVLEGATFDEWSRPERFEREFFRHRTTIDGQRAVVIEQVATGEGRLPRGTFTYRYLVEVDGGRTIAAATYDTDDSIDRYRRHRAVLDDMMATLEVR